MLITIFFLSLIIYILLRQKAALRKQLKTLKNDYEQLSSTNKNLITTIEKSGGIFIAGITVSEDAK